MAHLGWRSVGRSLEEGKWKKGSIIGWLLDGDESFNSIAGNVAKMRGFGRC
jgi:hypothetical protein